MSRDDDEGFAEFLKGLPEAQEQPAEHLYAVLQDHGETGWGPAAFEIDEKFMGPAVYTGSDPATLFALRALAEQMALSTGKETRLVCFREREDLCTFGGE